MSRRKRRWKKKYLAAAIAAGAVAAFLFLNRDKLAATAPLPAPQGRQTGYKAEDRQKLEQLINAGTRHD
jgi:hypothetical protein